MSNSPLWSLASSWKEVSFSTVRQRRAVVVISAARSMSGEFSSAVKVLLGQLIHLRMLVEATLDFPEEEIDFLQKADAAGQLTRLQATLARVMLSRVGVFISGSAPLSLCRKTASARRRTSARR